MLGFENLKNRLKYAGGSDQETRMNMDKLRTLKKALLYSYQAATAVLSNGKEFRCLMNPNKLGIEFEEKIISIPFEDTCLNTKQIESTNLKVGDVFKWKENGSRWLITLKKDEETAYFRAICRKCRFEIEINKQKYWVYVRGPVEQSVLWTQKNGNYFNKLNYSLIMYITKDENTEDFFNRFKVIYLKGKPWEVQAVDSITSEGLIEIALKETYENSVEKNLPEIVVTNIDNSEEPYINGAAQVRPYDTVVYTVENTDLLNGNWEISNSKAKILSVNDNKVKIEIVTGRSGNFVLSFVSQNLKLEKEIEIVSL